MPRFLLSYTDRPAKGVFAGGTPVPRQDIPGLHREEFESREHALKFACELLRTGTGHDPVLYDENHNVLMDMGAILNHCAWQDRP